MKYLIVLLSLISSSASFAGNRIPDEATAVGAEVILRQIANPKYFGKDGLRAVKAALEGSYGGSLSADIMSMDCEPAGGSKDCLIGLKVTDSSRPPGFQDISFNVVVTVNQGNIISGGPEKVEW